MLEVVPQMKMELFLKGQVIIGGSGGYSIKATLYLTADIGYQMSKLSSWLKHQVKLGQGWITSRQNGQLPWAPSF